MIFRLLGIALDDLDGHAEPLDELGVVGAAGSPRPRALASASRSSAARNTCGVWAAQSPSRGGRLDDAAVAHALQACRAPAPRAAPRRSAPRRRRRARRRRVAPAVARRRAPRRARRRRAARASPARIESWRSAPPATGGDQLARRARRSTASAARRASRPLRAAPARSRRCARTRPAPRRRGPRAGGRRAAGTPSVGRRRTARRGQPRARERRRASPDHSRLASEPWARGAFAVARSVRPALDPVPRSEPRRAASHQHASARRGLRALARPFALAREGVCDAACLARRRVLRGDGASDARARRGPKPPRAEPATPACRSAGRRAEALARRRRASRDRAQPRRRAAALRPADRGGEPGRRLGHLRSPDLRPGRLPERRDADRLPDPREHAARREENWSRRSGPAGPLPLARRLLPGRVPGLGGGDQLAHLGALARVPLGLHRDGDGAAAARPLLERRVDAGARRAASASSSRARSSTRT